MRTLEVLVPGLWGIAAESPELGATPRTLSRILGRGRMAPDTGRGWEEALASRLGYSRVSGGRQALLAYPVALTPGLTDLVAEAVDDLSVAEAEALWATAVPDLQHSGIQRREAFPCVSEVELSGEGAWTGPPPSVGLGRPMRAPRLQDPVARRLQVFAGTLQMLWFDHPVNRDRAAAGRPQVQGLWLWSPGMPTDAPQARRVAGGGLTARWLAARVGVEWTADPLDAEADLVVIDALTGTTASESLRAIVVSLSEDILRPGVEALQRGDVDEVAIQDPGCWRIRLARGDWRRFWKRARTLVPQLR